ncbi:hypothetical protein BDD12DRAFT_718295, partial [Trichophaea hybrida]
WVSEPQYRGTWSIIYSCTLTIILTVYKSLHLNIPGPDEGKLNHKLYIRGVKWAAIALIAPEFVLMYAFVQWHEAIRLCAELQDFKHFPLKYGFYVGMGGFAIDTTKLDPGIQQFTLHPRPILPTELGEKRAAVTASGVLHLARKGHFLLIKPETISDKSKADTLAKFLAIFQVSWLVVETCARKANGVPITLLEIHTLVHVFCALVMYGFWLKKPVGIRDPSIIDQKKANIVWEEHKSRVSNRSTADSPRIFPWKLARRVSSRYDDAISPRAYGTPHIVYDFGLSEYLIIRSLMVVVAAAYGGVHLAAWSFDLPTEIENYLWKASCIIMVVSSLPMPCWSLMGNMVFYQNLSVWRAIQELHKRIWCSDSGMSALRFAICAVLYTYLVFSLLLLPLCIISRVAIIFESFICLRQVPQGVYVKVPWTQYIPH